MEHLSEALHKRAQVSKLSRRLETWAFCACPMQSGGRIAEPFSRRVTDSGSPRSMWALRSGGSSASVGCMRTNPYTPAVQAAEFVEQLAKSPYWLPKADREAALAVAKRARPKRDAWDSENPA